MSDQARNAERTEEVGPLLEPRLSTVVLAAAAAPSRYDSSHGAITPKKPAHDQGDTQPNSLAAVAAAAQGQHTRSAAYGSKLNRRLAPKRQQTPTLAARCDSHSRSPLHTKTFTEGGT
jgi:hypothetical protein